MSSHQARSPRVFAIPLDADAYTKHFNAALTKAGVDVRRGDISGRFIMRHVGRGAVVHLHWPSFGYYSPKRSPRSNYFALARFTLLLLLVRLRGARIAWTAHNLYPHDGGPLLIHRIGRRIVIALSDIILVHGERAASIVSRQFGIDKSKLVVGHHAHWIGSFADDVSRQEARARLELPQEAFVYCFFGLLKPYKGLELLLESFSRVQIPGARLLIAGRAQSPEYLARIRKIAERDNRICIVEGSVPDDEVQWIMRAANCVVLPYTSVLTSGAAMLAMSFGCPVVVPDVGSLRDHVSDRCGVVYSADEHDALFQALVAMHDLDFDGREIRQSIEGFTWDRLAIAFRECAIRM